ncbi:MAG: hypothetical protein ACR2HG_08035 [Pyrinomonadaceae bacterium]
MRESFSLLVLSLPAVASAQYRNDRNNRNLQSTIKDLKNRSKDFERRLDRELDRSRYDGRNREDRLNQLAKDFKDAAKNLDDSYDNRRDYNRSSDEAQRVLQLGNQLDRALQRARLNGNLQNDWSGIRQDLNMLANAYSYNNNNRNNRRNNGDWRSQIPFPLPF